MNKDLSKILCGLFMAASLTVSLVTIIDVSVHMSNNYALTAEIG